MLQDKSIKLINLSKPIQEILEKYPEFKTIKSKSFQQNNETYIMPSDSEVISIIQEAANLPIEDRYLASYLPFLGQYSLVTVVFDGHGGDHCAQYAERNFLYYLMKYFYENPSYDINNALIYAIKSIEDNYTSKAREIYQRGIEYVTKNGVCLTACILHRPTNIDGTSSINNNYTLSIANLGDCEVGIVSQYGNIMSGKMIGTTHSTKNKNEREYLRKQFPNDTNIILKKNKKMEKKEDYDLRNKTGVSADGYDDGENSAYYVKEVLMPTRSLGDLYMKYDEFSNNKDKKKYNLVNFPYIRSDPDIINIDIKNNDKYILLATDGLWDYLNIDDISLIIEYYFNESESINNNYYINKKDIESNDIMISDQNMINNKCRFTNPDLFLNKQNKYIERKIIQRIKDELLRKVCLTNNLNIEKLNQIPLGKKYKRKYHDDITIMIIDLKNYVTTESL
eukprot:Mrub_03522.p1 GENE.Mrub_03522~~Mrub_03522.p1  ORF type:complete len:472 (-),score=58.50 Mrub_03522:23-1378(-)